MDAWNVEIETRLRAVAAEKEKRKEEGSAHTDDQRQQLQRETMEWKTAREKEAMLASSEIDEPMADGVDDAKHQQREAAWAAAKKRPARRVMNMLCVSSDIEGGPNALSLT